MTAASLRAGASVGLALLWALACSDDPLPSADAGAVDVQGDGSHELSAGGVSDAADDGAATDDGASGGSADSAVADSDAATDAATEASDNGDAELADAAATTDAAPDTAPDTSVSEVAITDAASADAASGDVSGDSVGPDATCKPQAAFDYACDAGKPATCPGGICAFSFCIGPKLNPDRWKGCADGVCGPCEDAKSCPADCAPPPTLSGKKAYDGETTLTIWVHGFTNKKPDDIAKMTYGAVKGCSDVLESMALFGVKRPCGAGADVAKSKQHMVAVEYYGSKAPDWMTAADIATVEALPFDKGALGLPRYAHIVAKFARWRLEVSGATHVQFACHSMGCLITRHLIEHDLEGLASQQKVVRWSSHAGVVAGARLARLYDNPQVQQAAKAIGLELSDFVLMNPDNVLDSTAHWDHRPYEGNNPLWKGIWIHHTVATDPKIKQALNIALLDLNNPGDEPNDGIMYTLDEFFHDQKASGASVTAAGVALPSTRSYAYLDHMNSPEGLHAGLFSAAALFHKRKVRIVLEKLELLDDLEQDGPLDFKNAGQAPAEVAAEVAVRYNPYVLQTFGKDVLVSEQRVAHRSAEVQPATQGQAKSMEWLLFAGPVFDDMQSLTLDLQLLEVDWYPRFGVLEWLLDPHQLLYGAALTLPLENKVHALSNGKVKLWLRVELHTLY